MQTQNITLNVIGMNCMGCVKAISSALQQLSGVSSVHCDLSQKTVSVIFDADSVSRETLEQTIKDEGFKIKE